MTYYYSYDILMSLSLLENNDSKKKTLFLRAKV